MPNHVDDRLTAFIHDELDETAVRMVERHLDECDACRAELAELQRTDALVAGLATVEAPDDLWPAIERHLDEHDASATPHRWWLGAAAAALVVLALAAGILVDRSRRPDAGMTLDVTSFLTALEAEPRQDLGREFALLPDGFEKIEPADAARAAGLGDTPDDMPTPDSQLFGGRMREVAGARIYELIYGNDDGPYILFIAPTTIELDFGRRRLGRCPMVSPSCARVASDSFAVFGDSGQEKQWVLIGRDHSDTFYAEVLRFVADSAAR